MWDEGKLSSYINNMLVPMATAQKAHKALFAWEIINEAEGLVRAGESDRESCFDTQVLSGTGAGWAKKYVPMKNLLGFINRQAAAIKNIRGNEIMVTASGWSEKEFRVKRRKFLQGTKIDRNFVVHSYNIPYLKAV